MKTGTDAGAAAIDLNTATPTTISALIGPGAPNPIPVDSRVSPIETTVWIVDAILTAFKVEGDTDYHLVIADASGNTMIAEIPSPGCVGAGSPFNSAIAETRAKFDAAFTVSNSFQTANVPVRVKGVGMFDFLHGQRGVARNGIELHPVLDIVLNPGADFTISASPAAMTVAPGTTGNASILTSVTGAFPSPLSLSASGAPPGVSVSFASPSIPAGGSSGVAFSVDTTAASGPSVVTINASGGGLTHSTNINLNVQPVSGPDFTISAAPQSVAVMPGGSNSAGLSVTPGSGFSADVSLSASGPPGLNAAFSPATVPAPGSGTSALTVTADASAAPGTSAITILASGGGMTHTAALTVSVCGRAAPAPALSHMALTPSHVPPEPALRDEDDNQIQLLPSAATQARSRSHGRSEVCHPLQFSVFLGSGWADPANHRRESALAHLHAGLIAPSICAAGARGPMRAEIREVEGDPTGPATLTDLQIQARLASMLREGTLSAPKPETFYLVFLAPEVQSTLASAQGGRDFLAFYNHFHASQGEVRYIVVPFDPDSKKEIQTASRALVRALIGPDGG